LLNYDTRDRQDILDDWAESEDAIADADADAVDNGG